MTTNLEDRPSDTPVPTGAWSKVAVAASSIELAWPATDTYFFGNQAKTIPMQVGTFNRPDRYWLKGICNAIHRVNGTWESGIIQLRLATAAGIEIADLEGKSKHYGYFTDENSSTSAGASTLWRGMSMECSFLCEANQGYVLQMISGGGGGFYYVHPTHLSLVGYTIGEGIL